MTTDKYEPLQSRSLFLDWKEGGGGGERFTPQSPSSSVDQEAK